MQKVKTFIKEHWMPIAFLVLVIIIICLEARRRKNLKVPSTESKFFRDSFLFYPMEYMLTPDNRVEDLRDLNYDGESSKVPLNSNKMPQYSIPQSVEEEAAKNQYVADTLNKFKSIFENGKDICDLAVLIQKGNEKKILIMDSSVTHTMEFNPRRVIVDVLVAKCVGPGCWTTYVVKSIG